MDGTETRLGDATIDEMLAEIDLRNLDAITVTRSREGDVHTWDIYHSPSLVNLEVAKKFATHYVGTIRQDLRQFITPARTTGNQKFRPSSPEFLACLTNFYRLSVS